MKLNAIRITLILVVVAVTVGMLYLRNSYFDERGRQGELLSEIDCAQLLPSDLELQGVRSAVPPERTCNLIKRIAMMKELQEKSPGDTTEPWHYFGRMRIKLTRDVWFLVFRARKSEGYRRQFALRHWKGSGWTIIGDFDAAEVLKMLGVDGMIDDARLAAPDALKPTDQSEEM